MSTINLFFLYFAVISFLTVLFTTADKINAKKGRQRVREDFLLTLGLLGGALSEFITMKIIHHKTRHNKSMIGLPVLITIQIIAILLIVIYTQRG